MLDSNLSPEPPRPLPQAVAARGGLPLAESLALLRQLLTQVRELHAAGRTHRALGPDTVSVDQAGNALLAPPQPLRELGGADGDPDACPPELQRAEPLNLPEDIQEARAVLRRAGVDLDPRRIDIYQVGTLLCWLFTGQPVTAYLCSPRAKAQVPPPLRPVLERALGYQQAERFTDCDQLAEALAAAAGELATAGQTPPPRSVPAESAATPVAETTPPPCLSPLASADQGTEGLPFERLGHYRIVQRLGSGGMGDVYLGHEESLQRLVAIKVLPTLLARNEDFVRRFQAEATAVARLSHPNIIAIHFIGQDAGHHFFAMQYVEGESLDLLLARKGRLNVDQALLILEQCLAGLGAAHQAGLTHRDVKPANILLDRKARRAMVADFGLVKGTGAGLTATGVVMGTVDYIAPEQARGQEVDGRADLYALGVVAYQMLSGRLPFQADSPSAMLFQHAYEAPRPLREAAPDVPEGLAAVVERLLVKDPAQRYQSCAEVLAEVRRVRAGQPPLGSQARPTTGSPSRIIRSEELPPPELPAELQPAAAGGLWGRLGTYLRGLFHAHAPEFLKQLQSTSQQMDGALADYQGRRDRLARLVDEARAVADELAAQARSHREGAADAARRQALREKEAEERTAVELEAQAAEQREQLAQLELRLAQADATLGRLRNQRDLLQARLRVAEANLRLAGADRPRRRRVLVAAVLGLSVLVLGSLLWIVRTSIQPPAHEPEQAPETRPSAQTDNLIPQLPDMKQPSGPSTFSQLQEIHRWRGPAFRIAISPDGRSLAGQTGEMPVWDLDANFRVRKLVPSPPVPAAHSCRSLAFTPDSKFVVAGLLREPMVTFLDAENGKVALRLGYEEDPPLHVFALSPDGRRILTGSRSSPSLKRETKADYTPRAKVRLWDIEQKKELFTFPDDPYLSCLAWDQQGKRAALAPFSPPQLYLWDLQKLERMHSPLQLGGLITAVDFSPDGQSLLVATAKELNVLDLGTFTFQATWSVSPLEITGAIFLPNGRQILAWGLSRTGTVPSGSIQIWDVASGNLVVEQKCPDQIQSAVYHAPTARLFTDVLNDIVVWSLSGPGPGTSSAPPPMAPRLPVTTPAPVKDPPPVTGDPPPPSAAMARTELALHRLEFPKGARGLAYAPDGTYFLADAGDDIQMWDARQLTVLRTFPRGDIRSARHYAISPDSRLILCGDATARLWDAKTGKEVRHLSHDGVVSAVAFSPDGKHALTASFKVTAPGGPPTDCALRVWEVETGSLVLTHPVSRPLQRVAFSAEGTLLGYDDTVHVWDKKSGQEVRTFPPLPGAGSLPAFSPDGRFFLVRQRGLGFDLWDTTTGQRVRQFPGHGDAPTCLAFSPDGRRALLGGGGMQRRWVGGEQVNDSSLSLWDLQTGQRLCRLEGHTNSLLDVAFSPDGKYALSSAADKTLRIWQLPAVPTGTGPPAAAKDPAELHCLRGHDGPVLCVAFAADGRRALSGGEDGTVRLWDLEKGQEIARPREHAQGVQCVAFSKDGRLALSAGKDRSVRLWDLEKKEPVWTRDGLKHPLQRVAFSPDSRYALFTSFDGVRLWDLKSGSEVRRFLGPKVGNFMAQVIDATFSPDGQRVLYGTDKWTAHVWDVSGNQELQRYDFQVRETDRTWAVRRLIVMPSGSQALSVMGMGMVRLWDLKAGEGVPRINHGGIGIYSSDLIRNLVISPEESKILMVSAPDHFVKLYDLQTGRMLQTFSGPQTTVPAIAFSPDGQRVLTGGEDGTVRLWQIAAQAIPASPK